MNDIDSGGRNVSPELTHPAEMKCADKPSTGESMSVGAVIGMMVGAIVVPCALAFLIGPIRGR